MTGALALSDCQTRIFTHPQVLLRYIAAAGRAHVAVAGSLGAAVVAALAVLA